MVSLLTTALGGNIQANLARGKDYLLEKDSFARTGCGDRVQVLKPECRAIAI